MSLATPVQNTEGTPYWVELAFDWHAGPHPTIESRLLQIGLAVHPEGKDGQPAPASFARGMNVGDTVGFMLYDNTVVTPEESKEPPKLLKAEVWLSPTSTQQEKASPFGLTSGLAIRPLAGSAETRSSATFGKDLPAWPLFRSPAAADPSPPSFALAHPGRFYLSASVEVEWKETVQEYRVDPEMIVSNTGTGGNP